MTFKNAISWFEIPATNISRAQTFYETIFDIKMESLEFTGIQMRVFPVEDKMTGITGCICYEPEFHKSSPNAGTLIYLNANPDVQTITNRIEAAGGKIIVPKTEISADHGYMAVFLDTEGNRIALHSLPEKYINPAE